MFAINAAGAWTYTAATAHNEFVAGTTYTDSFTVATADGTTSTVTVNILGTNDAAVITPALVNLTETNAILTTSGTLAITDVDSPATFVAQAATAGALRHVCDQRGGRLDLHRGDRRTTSSWPAPPTPTVSPSPRPTAPPAPSRSTSSAPTTRR